MHQTFYAKYLVTMKTFFIFILLMISNVVLAENWFQYPEERTYTSADQGYTQYGAPSLHRTGRYSLTFDDGPHPIRTVKVLDSLKQFNVKATFFVVTAQINEGNFPIIKRILDEGHLLASHGRTHDNSNNLTRDQFKSRVKQSFVDLAYWYKRAGHVLNKPFYRFPYAAYAKASGYHHMNVLKEISRELMGDNCIQFAFWDHDSGDWIPKMTGPEIVANMKATNEGGTFITYKTVRINGKLVQVKVWTTMNNPLSGGVVLLHDIQQSTFDGITGILQYFQESNIETLRLDEVEEFAVTKNCQMR
jgi:peptidoglycan-N-acetylglucosamine deacetylase